MDYIIQQSVPCSCCSTHSALAPPRGPSRLESPVKAAKELEVAKLVEVAEEAVWLPVPVRQIVTSTVEDINKITILLLQWLENL